MNDDAPSTVLLDQYRAGDDRAADELFRRYLGRLTVLARARLAPRIARRVDPEDIVLSAYRSFFLALRDGRFRLEQSGDLWRLLVAMTLNKLHRTVAHHQAGRRSVAREQTGSPQEFEATGQWNPRAPIRPEEAVALAELLESVLSELQPQARTILELRLQDYEYQEIATAIGRSERTIRRELQSIQTSLAARLTGGPLERDILKRRFAPAGKQQNPMKPVREAAEAPASNAGADGIAEPLLATSAPVLSGGDFVIERHVGSGGIGRVYRAWMKEGRQTIAVKILRKKLQHDAGAAERFLREAETLSLLRHPGIVALRGVGRMKQGSLFLVMDFIGGRNLAEVLRDGPIAPVTAVAYVIKVAEAVQYAHEWGVIHCDLKPANVMLDDTGTIHVTDFGLAARLRPGITADGAGGTLGYMAPEQLDPAWGRIGPMTDVFGLGALLGTLLTRQPPVPSKSVAGALRKILTGLHWKTLESAGTDIPQPLLDVCRRCLVPLPRDRFESAAEFASALRAVIRELRSESG